MNKVLFIPDLKSVEVETGTSVIEAAERAGVLIDASCNGNGTCGKCRVKINGEYVLACQTGIDHDMEIAIPATHGGSGRKKKMVKLPDSFKAECNIVKHALKVRKARMDYQVNDMSRVREALEMPHLMFRHGLVNVLHPALEAGRGNVSLTINQFRCKCGNSAPELIAIESGDTSEHCYGIAFDIGTTTVVGMLWNLTNGELVDVEARTNYQSLYGADVISRIQFSLEGDGSEHLEILQSKVIQCCNDILEEICERSEIRHEHIYDATVVGNTTMSHLVFGITPVSMSRTPFAPVFTEAQDKWAYELGININGNANVHLLPNIAGHVGSDITGMMLAAGIDSIKGNHIAIDIGTNGEVVAVKDGRMVCCSTAAGPAFEGATIHQGMRAAAGAIEKVSIDDEGVHIKTIDDAEAVGICGSGLIDALAELLRIGVVDKSGRMMTREQALEKGVSTAVAERIVGKGVDAYFVLASTSEGENLILNQGDIREVQLAKGAILAGIQTLIKELDMSVDDIDSIMLAGAFGNYIDKISALGIGLLPKVDPEIIVAIGNAAGAGCCMALLSEKERRHADLIAAQTEHVELSMNPIFQDYYIDAMSFV